MKQTDFGEIRGNISSLKSSMHEGNENILTQLQKMSDEFRTTAISDREATVSHLTNMENQFSGEIREAASNTSSPVVEYLTGKIDDAASVSKKQDFVTWALISICIIIMTYSVMLKR